MVMAAAAAAKTRVIGMLMPMGAEGSPPLPSSLESQFFVVGGGARELLVLVVVSGEHGENSGQVWGWVTHPHLEVPFCCLSYCPPQLLSQTGSDSTPPNCLYHLERYTSCI